MVAKLCIGAVLIGAACGNSPNHSVDGGGDVDAKMSVGVDANMSGMSATLLPPIAMPGAPVAMAFDPVANELWVSVVATPSSADPAEEETVLVDGAARAVSSPLLHQAFFGIGILPGLRKVYAFRDTQVTVFDADTHAVKTTIPVGEPGQIAVDAVTNKVFVTGMQTLREIDGTTDQIIAESNSGAADLVGGPEERDPSIAVDSVHGKVFVLAEVSTLGGLTLVTFDEATLTPTTTSFGTGNEGWSLAAVSSTGAAEAIAHSFTTGAMSAYYLGTPVPIDLPAGFSPTSCWFDNGKGTVGFLGPDVTTGRIAYWAGSPDMIAGGQLHVIEGALSDPTRTWPTYVTPGEAKSHSQSLFMSLRAQPVGDMLTAELDEVIIDTP
jgi:hypothetical protein